MNAGERREQVLEAARGVFAERGYAASTDEVARAAGVSQPYVVRIFGSKRDLFLAVYRDTARRVLDALGSVPAAPPAGQREGDPGTGAVGLLQLGEGQFVGVEHRVVLLLPAVAGEGLPEVPVAVQQPDADEGHAEIAGRLQMVAREDAETSGVLRQGGRDAELGGEISHGAGQSLGLCLIPAVTAQIVVQIVRDRVQTAPEPPVPGEFGESRGPHPAQQPHRVAPGGAPCLRVHGLEQIARLRMP